MPAHEITCKPAACAVAGPGPIRRTATESRSHASLHGRLHLISVLFSANAGSNRLPRANCRRSIPAGLGKPAYSDCCPNPSPARSPAGARQWVPTRATVYFNATGTELSTVGAGTLPVDCVSLDESLENESPTLIKFDIEGFELEALAGARETIRRHTPILAVSAYHRQKPPLGNPLRDPGYRGWLSLLFKASRDGGLGPGVLCHSPCRLKAALPIF